MARSIPIISTSEHEVTDEWGQMSVRHAWEIRRAGLITETGTNYDSGIEALQFAIGVAEGTNA